MIARLLCVAMLVSLVGCGDEPSGNQTQPSMVERIAEITSAKTNPVAPEQVSEVFALGSEFTDLQRDILRKELVGSVVEWEIHVYEIDYADGIYKVTSQPIPIKSKQAVNMLRASFSVYPQDDRDHELLRKAKTNDRIKIRGQIQDIVLRTVVLIEPALLVTQP
ncbi:MAG: hypothetical protein Q8O37_12875 [Sulfuricellaceae bacterium]|nr:hypothetical protein [Sulfuricellaceae bacterium]